jgi:sulfotransferase family protein
VTRDFVTIVSGAPRSGTSMMMRMLAEGGIPPLTDGVRQPDRDNPHGYFEYEPVKRTKDDPSWLDGARGRAVKMVHVLLRDLPADRAYRVILMRRDLKEMLASQRLMLERLGREAGKLSDERMAEIFAAQLDATERWLRGHAAFSCLAMSYNDVVAEPRPHAARVSEFLGGGLDENAMCAVVDPALWRNRAR